MAVHDLSEADAVARLEKVARRILTSYAVSPAAELTLLNVSENATYAVDDPDSGDRTVLRIHRLGYHDAAEITSELAWLDALREDAGVPTPHVLPTSRGERLVALNVPESAAQRHAVMFEWLPGIEPPSERLTESYSMLGEITARMHRHVRGWIPPAGFTRFAWDYDGSFGPHARWGGWRDGIGVGAPERAVLGRLDDVLRRRLSSFGMAGDRYGLIHADLRLANLLVESGRTQVIDFDDCGWGWFLYDLGAAVSFLEDDPRVPELVDSWVQGYRKHLPLPAADEAEIPTFILMRRLLLVAWIGTHSGTDLARSMGADYTAGSCELAENYLSRFT